MQITFPILILIATLIINLWLLRFLRSKLLFSPNTHCNSLMSSTDYNVSGSSATSTSRASGINMYVLLLGCTSLYFFTQFPAVIVNAMFAVASHLPPEETLLWCALTSALHYARPVAWTLSKVNYSVNFLLYAGLSKRYRALSREALCGKVQNRGLFSPVNMPQIGQFPMALRKSSTSPSMNVPELSSSSSSSRI